MRERPARARSGAPSVRAGTAAVLAAAVLFSTTGTASSWRPEAATPVQVGAARLVFGGLVLLAWAAARGGLRPLAGTGRRGAVVAGLGVLGVVGYQLSFFSAVARTGVAIGTVVALGSAPVLTGLLARLARGAPLSARWAVSTAVAVCGCSVLVLGGAAAGVDPLGVGLALLAGLSYATYALAAAELIDAGSPSGSAPSNGVPSSGVPSSGVMAALFGAGGLLLLPVLLAGTPGWLLTGRGALVVAHLAVVTLAVAYLLYGWGLRSVPVATAATLTLAEPAGAALLGLLLLGEPARPTTLLGIGLVAAALAVLVVRPGATTTRASGSG